jgi:hypothetical protein
VTSADTLTALRKIGFGERERLPLRFWFEVTSLREAVDLAAELRRTRDTAVELRPAPRRLMTRRPWRVVLRTPSTLLTLAVIASRERDMEELADRWGGCHFIGWTPVLDPADVKRIVFKSEGRPT